VCLVVGDSLLVVDAAVQGDVDAEGQESHAASLSRVTAAEETNRTTPRQTGLGSRVAGSARNKGLDLTGDSVLHHAGMNSGPLSKRVMS
jgi:hypothetical protein